MRAAAGTVLCAIASHSVKSVVSTVVRDLETMHDCYGFSIHNNAGARSRLCVIHRSKCGALTNQSNHMMMCWHV